MAGAWDYSVLEPEDETLFNHKVSRGIFCYEGISTKQFRNAINFGSRARKYITELILVHARFLRLSLA